VSAMDQLKGPCPFIFREAQNVVDDLMEKFQDRQVAYDRGAVRAPWPPPDWVEPGPPTRDVELDDTPSAGTPAASAPSETTAAGAPSPTPDPNLPQHLPPNFDPGVYTGPPVARDVFSAVRRDLAFTDAGLVVGLYHKGKLDYLEAFGTPTPESEEVLLPTDVFAFPALTEVLLGITIDALDEAGVLDMDAPISTYVSGIDRALRSIRLRQLLTHRAGLDNARVPDSVPWAKNLDKLDRRAVFSDPGTLYSLSRYSYPLAMKTVEQAVGVPFADLVKATILEPLGMDSTTFDPEMAQSLGMTSTVTWPSKRDFTAGGEPAPTIEALPVSFTSVPDMLKLLSAWVSGGIPGSSPMRPEGASARYFEGGVWSDVVDGVQRVKRVCRSAGFGAGFYLFPETRSVAVLWGVGNWPSNTARFLLNQLSVELEVGPAIFGSGTWGGNASIGEREVRCVEEPPQRALLPEDASPAATGQWAGRYYNGDRLLELVDSDGVLIFNNAGNPMEVVHFLDQIYFTRMAGQPMFPLELLLDEEGLRYVRMTGRAYVHADDRRARRP
jgi:CubicO group peptidase (beta-lactamase class C family)